MANRTTQKSISSQACKTLSNVHAYKTLQVKFSFSEQFISAGLFYNMAALLSRKNYELVQSSILYNCIGVRDLVIFIGSLEEPEKKGSISLGRSTKTYK